MKWKHLFMLAGLIMLCVAAPTFGAFQDNHDGTIIDTATGLMWQKCSMGQTYNASTNGCDGAAQTFNWQQALAESENLVLGGHSDWRLPNRNELQSIVDYSRNGPAINTTYFSNTMSSAYWSSTTYANYSDGAWRVGFYSGVVSDADKDDYLYVRAVRSGQGGSSGDFVNLVISRSGTGSGMVMSADGKISCGSDCSESYSTGTTVTLTAISDSGSIFSGWGGDCSSCGTGSACSIVMETSKSCTATYQTTQPSQHTITATVYPSQGGSITCSPNPVNDGETSVCTITVNNGYTFDNVTGTCGGTFSDNTFITDAVTSDCMVQVNFNHVNISLKINSVRIFINGDEIHNPVFLDGVDLDVKFVPEIDWDGGQPGEVQYITPSGTYASSAADGSMILNVGQIFGAGGKLKVKAVSAEGSESELFEVPFDVAEPPFLTSNYFKFNFKRKEYNSINLPLSILDLNVPGNIISADIPIWGGKRINVSLDSSSFFAVDLSGNGTITIGIDDASETNPSSCVFIAGKKIPFFQKIKNTVKHLWATKECSIGLDIDSPTIKLRYDRQIRDWDIWGSLDMGFSGYCQTLPTYLPIVIGGIPIPLYYQIGLGIDTIFTPSILLVDYSSADGYALDWEGIFTLNPSGKLIFGLGVTDIATVEGYGEGGLTAKWEWGYSDKPHLMDLYCSLVGGVKLTLYLFHYDLQLLDKRWPEAKSQMAALEVQAIEEGPVPRDYLRSPNYARFHGLPNIKAQEVATSNTQEELLQEDVFPYSDPVIVSRDGNTYIFWIYDDPERSTLNRTELVFSKWTGSSWSNPVPVMDDGTADFRPSADILSDGRVLVVWQNIKGLMADSASLKGMIPKSEIAYGIYDPSTNTWQTGSLTINDYWDRSPKISAGSNNAAIVMWISNTGNSLMGDSENPNNLRYAFFNGDGFTDTGDIASGLGPILGASLAYTGTDAVVAWSSDEDGDLTTQEDTEIRISTFSGSNWETPWLLTNDSEVDISPQVLIKNGRSHILWIHGNDLVMARDLDISTAETAVKDMLGVGGSSFKALPSSSGITLFWSDGSTNGTDIFINHWLEDQDVWGAPKQVTADSSLERSISGCYVDKDTMKLIYDKTAMVEGDDGTLKAGKTDLYLLTYNENTDIILNSLYANKDNPTVGEQITITAQVANVGDTAQENIPVYFYKGFPSQGNIIGQAVLSGILAPEKTSEVSISWQVEQLPVTIYAVADPNHEITEDVNFENNEMSLRLPSERPQGATLNAIFSKCDSTLELELDLSENKKGVALQFDINYDSQALVLAGSPAIGSNLDSAGFMVSMNSNIPPGGILRIIISPPLVSTFPVIPNGNILTIKFRILSNGNLLIPTFSDLSCSDGDGNGITLNVAKLFTLSITKSGIGEGIITSNYSGIDCGNSCSKDFPAGSIVVLSARANANSVFKGWSGDCSSCGDNASCYINMDTCKNCIAMFDREGFSLGDANGDGQINVLDVISVINKILKPNISLSGDADCNGDGIVNVLDVICIINKILQGS